LDFDTLHAFLPPSVSDVHLAAAALLLLFLLSRIYRAVRLRAKLSPIPAASPLRLPALPFLGSILDFTLSGLTPWDLMASWHAAHGPIYRFVLLGRECISVSSPSLLKDALQSRVKVVQKDVDFAYAPFLSILGRGIVTSEGKEWMRQRASVGAALKHDILDDIPKITLRMVRRMCVVLDAAAASGSSPVVEMAGSLRHLTLQVISDAFLGLDPDESDGTFAQMYLPIVDEANRRVWAPYRAAMVWTPQYWRHLAAVRRLDRYVSGLITGRWDERRRGSGGKRRKDVLDNVLKAYERSYGISKSLPTYVVKQVRDEMKTFMLAGHETTAAMMTWSVYELMKDKGRGGPKGGKMVRKITTEAEEIFGKGYDCCAGSLDEAIAALPDRETLGKLCFSEGCLKEALRKYSVVPTVARQVVEDTKFGSHVVPRGTTVMIGIQAMHLDPLHWPEPFSYCPERFVDPSPRPQRFTFLPFIDGPRDCLGQYLALLESKMVLAMLFQRYNFSMEDTIEGDPRHIFMVPIVPKEDINLTFRRRL